MISCQQEVVGGSPKDVILTAGRVVLHQFLLLEASRVDVFSMPSVWKCSSFGRFRRAKDCKCELRQEIFLRDTDRLQVLQCLAFCEVGITSAKQVRSFIRGGLFITNVSESLAMMSLANISRKWNAGITCQSFLVQQRFQALAVRAYNFRVDKFRKGAGLASLSLGTLGCSWSAHLSAAQGFFCFIVVDCRRCFSSLVLSLIQPAWPVLLSVRHASGSHGDPCRSESHSTQGQKKPDQLMPGSASQCQKQLRNSRSRPCLPKSKTIGQIGTCYQKPLYLVC